MITVHYKSIEAYILVVGCNSTIGIELCKTLLSIGAMVEGVDIQPTTEIESQEGWAYHCMDPLKEDLWPSLVGGIEAKGKILNGLVCLSGTIKSFSSIEEMSTEAWMETFSISFMSCYLACRYVVPLLRKSESAAIVNMSSGLAYGGQKNYSPYTTAKASILSLSRTLASECAPDIRVNAIAPGAVDTAFIYNKHNEMRFNLEAYLSIIPQGRMAIPQDIVQAIIFLLSDQSTHITGQVLHINGGALMA